MKKETDLAGLKTVAKTLLHTDIYETPYSPMIVKHPFTDTGVTAIPDGNGGIKMINLLEDSDAQFMWRQTMARQIDKANSAYEIYMMVTKPYALTFLKFAMPNLSREDMSQILASAWTRSEAPHQDVNVTVKQLLQMFKQADRTYLMEQEEYNRYKSLGDSVTVYRGVTPHNAKSVKALSWSLSRETAEWFANRFGEKGTVYEAQISTDHIYAYFSGRNESEVIVDPFYLRNITEVQNMTSDFLLGGNQMTIYQEEMQRKAFRYGCTAGYDEEKQQLLIAFKGTLLAGITDKGFMHYTSKDLTDPETRSVFFRLLDDVETVREYVELYESSPQMKPKDVRNYHKFAEYGDVVFAGMYSQKHGFMFCSWKQSDGGSYLAHGDYSPDYLSSKENFAIRAGLINKEKIFTQEEAEELFKCVAFARDNCDSLTYEQDRSLMGLMEKLQRAYPHLKDNPPSFDEDEGMQINM